MTQGTAPIAKAEFPDVGPGHQYYVAIDYAESNGIANGYENGLFDPEGKLTPAQAEKMIRSSQNGFATCDEFTQLEDNDNVSRSIFIKVLLSSAGFEPANWKNRQYYSDTPPDAWFTPYMNYGGLAGLIKADQDNNLYPSRPITRGESAQAIYAIYLIQNRKNNNLLLRESEKFMNQVEYNIEKNDYIKAKQASEMFVSITQQTYRNNPHQKKSLGRAKIARAYDFLINGKIAKKNKSEARGQAWEILANIKAEEAVRIDKKNADKADKIKKHTEK